MNKPFVLSLEEKRSPLWQKLTEHWQGRLDLARIQNDMDKPELETAKQRGRIAELKANLALNGDPLIL